MVKLNITKAGIFGLLLFFTPLNMTSVIAASEVPYIKLVGSYKVTNAGRLQKSRGFEKAKLAALATLPEIVTEQLSTRHKIDKAHLKRFLQSKLATSLKISIETIDRQQSGNEFTITLRIPSDVFDALVNEYKAHL